MNRFMHRWAVPFILGVLLASLIISLSSAEKSNILEKWRERALVAKDRISQMQEQASSDLRCRYNCGLEKAFLPFCDEATCHEFIEKNNGTETYKMVIDCSDCEKPNTFVITFTYNSSSKKLVSHNVERLPDGWMMVSTNNNRLSLVDNNGNSITINLDEPTESYVAMAE